MESLSAYATAAGLAWASGLRLYAALFMAGLGHKLGWLTLPEALGVFSHPYALMATGALSMVEFVADKIPYVDSMWDVIQTGIRVPAGVVLSALAMSSQHNTTLTVLGAVLGLLIAGTTHVSKASARAAINTSPEPVSNVVTSVAEDGLLTAGLYTVFAHPAVFLVALVVFIGLCCVLLWSLAKFTRAVLTRVRRALHV